MKRVVSACSLQALIQVAGHKASSMKDVAAFAQFVSATSNSQRLEELVLYLRKLTSQCLRSASARRAAAAASAFASSSSRRAVSSIAFALRFSFLRAFLTRSDAAFVAALVVRTPVVERGAAFGSNVRILCQPITLTMPQSWPFATGLATLGPRQGEARIRTKARISWHMRVVPRTASRPRLRRAPPPR